MSEGLKELSDRATPGPWAAESEKSEGSYGSGEDTSEGYDTATIVTEAETRYSKAGVLFESHNSTVGAVREEHDEDWFRAWDEVSKANAEFIVALVNAYRSGQLHDATALAEAEARGRRQERSRCQHIARMHLIHANEPSELVASSIAACIGDPDYVLRDLNTQEPLATAPAETQKPEETA